MNFSLPNLAVEPEVEKKPDPLIPYDITLEELEIDEDKLLELIATGRDAIDYTHTIIAPAEVWEEEDENGDAVAPPTDAGGGEE